VVFLFHYCLPFSYMHHMCNCVNLPSQTQISNEDFPSSNVCAMQENFLQHISFHFVTWASYICYHNIKFFIALWQPNVMFCNSFELCMMDICLGLKSSSKCFVYMSFFSLQQNASLYTK